MSKESQHKFIIHKNGVYSFNEEAIYNTMIIGGLEYYKNDVKNNSFSPSPNINIVSICKENEYKENLSNDVDLVLIGRGIGSDLLSFEKEIKSHVKKFHPSLMLCFEQIRDVNGGRPSLS